MMNCNCVDICVYVCVCIFLNSFNGMEIKRLHLEDVGEESYCKYCQCLNSGDLVILNKLGSENPG